MLINQIDSYSYFNKNKVAKFKFQLRFKEKLNGLCKVHT